VIAALHSDTVLLGLQQPMGLSWMAQVDQMITQTPLGRPGQPTDIADAVRFTCVGQCPMDGQHI